MTNDDWTSIANLIASLWRPFADCMTDEQAKAWRSALEKCDIEKVKDALLHCYQREEGWPILSRIVAASQPSLAQVRPSYGGQRSEAERLAAAELTRAECRRGREMLAARRGKAVSQ